MGCPVQIIRTESQAGGMTLGLAFHIPARIPVLILACLEEWPVLGMVSI